MRVWRPRGQGRGWAEWRSRGRQGWGSMLGMGDLGLGNLGIPGGLNGPLLQAQRALHSQQIRQALGISDDQAKKLEDEVTQFRKTLIRDHAELQIQLIDLQTALAEQTPDQSRVDDSMQKVSAAQQALEKAAVDFVVTLKQEITPEQRQKIRQFLRARRGQGFSEERWEDRSPRKPGSASFAGSQAPNGSAYYTRNEAQLNGPSWQNSQSEPEQSPAPQPYTMGEPQGSTPMTNNQ
jgi:Spy/CpxP family protein refolding chaperone